MSILRFARRRPSPSLIVACCALFVALGGTSYAVAVNSIGSLEIRDGSIRDADVANRTLRGEKVVLDGIGGAAVKEQALDASKLGPVSRATAADTAAQADAATRADAAATAATSGGMQLQVVVSADGGRFHARGVTDVDKIRTGQYAVTFDRDVSDCVGVATLITLFDFYGPPNSASAGQISLQSSPSTGTAEQRRTVWVNTGGIDGMWRDRGFHLLVSC